MDLHAPVCPHCGAALNLNSNSKTVHCEFCDSDIVIEQPQNQLPHFLPGTLYDEKAFQKWKRKFYGCHIVMFLSVFIWLMLIEQDSHSDAALIPFLIMILIQVFAPIILSAQKPKEPDASRNRPLWNWFKYVMAFIGNSLAAFLTAIVTAMILDIK